jgi:membrane fusion protein (multidrug efflux system)
VTALAALLLAGCPGSAPVTSQDPSTSAEFAAEVVTTRLARGEIGQQISAPGSVVARRQSRIGTEVIGRIQRVYVSEGDRVEAGAPLFQIDPEAYEVALRQAEAGLDVARAQRAQLEADLARARELQRRKVVAEQEIERLATQLAVARAEERRAEEAVALARHNLARTLVPAPYAGSIAARLEDEGTTALVQPQTIVVILQETAELEAQAAIAESQLTLVRVGDRAFVHVEGLAKPIETKVSAVSDTIDPATRTYMVKMPVPNPEQVLKAGVFAHVVIVSEPRSGALLAPREAIRSEDGRTRLLVVENGQAKAVPVKVGAVSEDVVEILDGAAEGDEIIVGEAARNIAPGMPVRVVEARQGPNS